MKNLALGLLALTLFPAPAHASRLKIILFPVREIGRTIKDTFSFRDKAFSVTALAYLAAYGVDMYSTSRAFRVCSTCVEDGLFSKGTRSIGKLSLSWGALYLTNSTISRTFKTESPKPLRWLWPIGIVEQSAGHAAAAYRNYRYPILAPPDTKRPCPANIVVTNGTCTY